MIIQKIISELKALGSPERAKHSLRFFKTGKGEYGEGDIFLGGKVPDIRIIAKKYQDITLSETEELLHNKYHECRLAALIILVNKYQKTKNSDDKKAIYQIYINNTKYINNWDLVDLSAAYLVGAHLKNGSKELVYKFAKSKNLWERRISIISTFYFIRQNDFSDTLKISEILLHDKEDLMHKAVGWMLREIGKRNQVVEEEFLEKHYKTMPRTMLRYAIEKFDEKKKKYYMKKN
jgi:3-methyladenine DNA glycosylase AlkD